jgi:serine phosphatase RsbU (regulator of sigma subunit)
MSTRPPLLLPPAPPPGRLQRLGDWFLHRWSGRVVGVSLLLWALALVGLRVPVLAPMATVVVWVFGAINCLLLVRWILRRWLWRIRTKLILSYLFVAVVPLVLLGLFFALAGMLSSGVVASYMVTSAIQRRTDDLQRATTAALTRLGAGGASTGDAVEEALRPVKESFPSLSYTYVRDGHRIASAGTLPGTLPAWLQGDSFAGLVPGPEGGRTRLRGVARRGGSFLLTDVPVDDALVKDLHDTAGIQIIAAGGRMRSHGRGINIEIDDDSSRKPGAPEAPPSPEPTQEVKLEGFPFFASPDQVDWTSGEKSSAPVAFQYRPLQLVRVLTPGRVNTGDVLMTALAVVGLIFLIMYAIALLMGLLLARSITRSVHALHRGTERLRQGRFDQPIPVHSRDQLGELAESFNLMSQDIQQLMRESAEKERLEEELRIARRIQMSLLPQGTVTVPHVAIAAACIPATEVGGDYYDLLPLPGDRLAVLVADVSGKGTSAALYMAELKGLMLSLSRVHESPAALLAEANRILSGDMDARSFITMSYAVLDPRARRMRYARAGHSPLIHRAATGATRLLAPPGLGLGLDGGDTFERVLEEMEVPLAAGDVFVFFTDGISEAMNARGELFGEDRLRDLLQQDGVPSSEDLRDRVLEGVRRFVGEAPQHDDMTMVVLRIE